ncbi:ribosome biogenesis GTPase YqeH [Alkalicoccus urumqiensis]|uniref:Ribosome biogenesis GTPase YqeH n=1 Tax=Alkalicoccus urumqiensis TaxID=1548213 RepID=A0A2P6MFK5_ALKUR|nr:ribosome biogenesis GTPase YqeH [Alkalicoccus urumqiensis]PRO65075.1 ribosome biogenesis GTPase YqeH [Alkalicoccus urumqiensis]
MGEKIVCSGCGVEIQTQNKQEIGYAPPAALEREVVICQRCYRLKHYNEVPDISLSDDDFLRMLNELNTKDALLVNIVDIVDFDGSWLEGLPRFAGNNPVLLLGNKADLLPKSVKKNKVINWMKRRAKEYGLKPVETSLISASSKDSIEEAAALIDSLRRGRDVYVIGTTNVGKSTFINTLIDQFGESETPRITTSTIPGTTLAMINIPLDETAELYDTPGIINPQQAAHFVTPKELKQITPQREIKPKVYQLSAGQTLFLAGLGRVDFHAGEDASFIVYASNEIPLHRTKTEKADQLYADHAGTMLSPPADAETLGGMKMQEWRIPSEKTDIVFAGLGWVTVQGGPVTVRTHAPDGIGVTIRESII